ncbi:hypothetical protein JW926_01585 [Candidatus Sumerlaeota bacterium]|nr:hypothetical protein [Candidatus Sumerlaeota bacterium]
MIISSKKTGRTSCAYSVFSKFLLCLFITGIISISCYSDDGEEKKNQISRDIHIGLSPNPSRLENLAALEIQRYVYLRANRILPLIQMNNKTEKMKGILLFQKDSPLLSMPSIDRETLKKIKNLGKQEYLLKTIHNDKNHFLLICGGDTLGTLYGAYNFAEHLGVRFYLDGDVIPDRKIKFEIPELDETAKPLFTLRGIQPFHDFAEGPDWWNENDYKSVIAQLPKLRMNFIGLHTYPEKAPHAEPTVWIGLSKDIEPDGRVRNSYLSSYMNTIRAEIIPGNWGYESKKTGDYVCGADQLFDRDAFGPDVMHDYFPAPKTPDERNEIFNRTGDMLKNAFEWAHFLGIKTCVGTEVPLTIPQAVKDRIRESGGNPDDPATLKEIYKGIFNRIIKTYPIDFYWMWTNEGWTWSGIDENACEAVIRDMMTAYEAAREISAPFRMATCGWALGPQYDRSLFDNALPKDMPLSCINRQVGFTPVDKGFSRVSGRDKWAIPWLEDDPALTAPQLWVGRMRRDAADALDYGCTGLMGIHWRTGLIGPNVSALSRAAWQQDSWKEDWKKKRFVEMKPGPLSGKYANYPNNAIENTDDDPLYQTVRWDVSGYRFQVPNGMCQVTLKFCDPHYSESGKRVFHTLIQGKKVIDSLDIVKRVGKNVALDFDFKDIDVKDGWLRIDFDYVVEYPCIAAIVISGKGYEEKINCGGPAYRDFKEDWPADNQTEIMPGTGDFYQDWALHQFGPEAASQIASIFENLDNKLPRPLGWIDGPGGLARNAKPWEEVRGDYAFVDEMEALKPMIRGKGNLRRFDYWLRHFQYLRAAGKLGCAWDKFERIMNPIHPEKPDPDKTGVPDSEQAKKIAKEEALPVYISMIGFIREMEERLLATAGNIGEIGTITNIESHLIPRVITRTGKRLEEAMGTPLPPEAKLTKEYAGSACMFVPTHPGGVLKGEKLELKVIVLAKESPSSVRLFWRPLGSGRFLAKGAHKINRGVYRVNLIEREMASGIMEYYVEALTKEGSVFWPPSAPEICQTIVIVPTE